MLLFQSLPMLILLCFFIVSHLCRCLKSPQNMPFYSKFESSKCLWINNLMPISWASLVIFTRLHTVTGYGKKMFTWRLNQWSRSNKIQIFWMLTSSIVLGRLVQNNLKYIFQRVSKLILKSFDAVVNSECAGDLMIGGSKREIQSTLLHSLSHK